MDANRVYTKCARATFKDCDTGPSMWDDSSSKDSAAHLRRRRPMTGATLRRHVCSAPFLSSPHALFFLLLLYPSWASAGARTGPAQGFFLLQSTYGRTKNDKVPCDSPPGGTSAVFAVFCLLQLLTVASRRESFHKTLTKC